MNNEMFIHIYHILESCQRSLKWYDAQRRGLDDKDVTAWLNSTLSIIIYADELREIVNEWREKGMKEEE